MPETPITIDANRAVIAPIMVRIVMQRIFKKLGNAVDDCIVQLHPEQEAEWENIGIQVTETLSREVEGNMPELPAKAMRMFGLPIEVRADWPKDTVTFSHDGQAIAAIVNLGTSESFRA